jgi:hypothetical protein
MKRLLLLLVAPMFLATATWGCGEDEEVGGTTSPAISGSTTAAPAASPSLTGAPTKTLVATPPPDWKVYTDSVLGFYFAFPPKFEAAEPVTQSPICCPVRRFVELRPSGSTSEGIVVGVYEEVADVSVQEWTQTYSMCNLDARPGTDVSIGGRGGIICVGEPLAGFFDYWIILKDDARIIYVSAALNESEFQPIVDSFRFRD